MSATLSADDAGDLARRARRLMRKRRLSRTAYTVLDAALWSAGRRHGSAVVVASYGALARLAGCSRSAVAVAVGEMERLGLWTRTRRRVRVGWASRQVANLYRFCTASSEATAYKSPQEIILVPMWAQTDALTALEARRSVIEARLAAGVRR